MNKLTVVASLIATVLCSSAYAAPVFTDNIMTDAAGRTLYTFDKDEAGKSNCVGTCLTAWPVFSASESDTAEGEFDIVNGNAGRQWVWKSKPLYYFAGDTKSGDHNGDAKGGVWHIVSKADKTAGGSGNKSSYGN